MKALLDTHAFLWWNTDDPQLSARARAFIGDGRNEIYFSAASGWELAIKAARRRLKLPETPDRYVAERLRRHRFIPLAVELTHALHVYGLEQHHSDPFDRMLIAQSQLLALPLLTADRDIGLYDVEIIW